MTKHLVQSTDYSYWVEDIMIDGFEIFQPKRSFALSPLAIPFSPLKVAATAVNISRVADLDLKLVRPGRAGVVVTTLYEGRRHLGFGIDWDTGEITDFGGGAAYGKLGAVAKGSPVVLRRRRRKRRVTDKDAKHAAWREWTEEAFAKRIFGAMSPDDLNSGLAIYNQHMMIIIITLSVCPIATSQAFASIVSKMDKHEVRGIYWMSDASLRRQVACNKPNEKCPFRMYSKVRKLLKDAGNFYPSI
jgi:hypothetical protein